MQTTFSQLVLEVQTSASESGRMRLLAPIPVDRRPRRFVQLLAGLLLYGATMGMMVRAVLGLDPWDVFHQGVTAWINHWIPLSYGAVITIVSVVVLLLWIPLRQRPGIGTIANAAIIGFTTDATLAVLPTFTNLPTRIALMTVAIVGNAVAGALYIGAGLGPGPRDGLMTGLVARGVGSIRVVRTTIELTVLAVGWILGGVVGVGTVLYALAIGPLLHLLLPRLMVKSAVPQTVRVNRVPEAVGAGPSGTAGEIRGAAVVAAGQGDPNPHPRPEFHDPVAVDPDQIWEDGEGR
jgi:uncharacterized membrane protein YczE